MLKFELQMDVLSNCFNEIKTAKLNTLNFNYIEANKDKTLCLEQYHLKLNFTYYKAK